MSSQYGHRRPTSCRNRTCRRCRAATQSFSGGPVWHTRPAKGGWKVSAPNQPNIVVVMYDQLAPAALGCYGNPVTHAPTIDRLAREGVVFDAAYSNSPLCTPARYCMMTGQLPSATGGYDNAAYLAEHDPDVRPLRPARRLPHGARRQDALRRAGPAARLRGASYDRHLPGRLRVDAGLAAARRARRLVVPQHGLR